MWFWFDSGENSALHWRCIQCLLKEKRFFKKTCLRKCLKNCLLRKKFKIFGKIFQNYGQFHKNFNWTLVNFHRYFNGCQTGLKDCCFAVEALFSPKFVWIHGISLQTLPESSKQRSTLIVKSTKRKAAKNLSLVKRKPIFLLKLISTIFIIFETIELWNLFLNISI